MKKAVVIGAGTAGLTAGIRLTEGGWDVTVLEQQAGPGGNLRSWTRRGHTVDNCLHWLNGTRDGSRLNRLWRSLGVLGDGVGLVRQPFFYRSYLKSGTLTMWRDPDRAEAELSEKSPRDAKTVRRFFRDAKALAYGSPIARAAVIARWFRVSVGDFAASLRDPDLATFFSDYLGREYASLGLLFAYSAFLSGDADLPVGGSPGVAERLAGKLVSCGGKLICSVRVSGIVTKGGRAEAVLTDRGDAFPADRVIAACDPHVTFSRLLGHEFAPPSLARIDLDPRTPHFSSLHAAFSIPDPLPPGAAWTTVVSGDRTFLPERTGGRVILRAFAHEPGFAPEGRTVLQATCFVSDRDAEKWRARGADYAEKKDAFVCAVANAIRGAFPYAAPEPIDAWTPATYERYTGADRGDYIGWLLPAGVLPPRLPERVRGLENVSLASGWCRMPGGLPTAARSGARAAADAMIRDPLPRPIPGVSFPARRTKTKKRRKFDLPS